MKDVHVRMQDENMRGDAIDYESSNLKMFAKEFITNGLLSLHEDMKNVFNFTANIRRSFQMQFPEMDFIPSNLNVQEALQWQY